MVQLMFLMFIFAGKFSESQIFTEALLSFSNLLVIGNDQIIRREVTKHEHPNPINSEEHKLKLFLTVLENVEVLIELTSKKILGDKKKFIVIFLIQAVKCIGRLVLIVKYKNRISNTPAIEHLDRKNIFKQLRQSTATSGGEASGSEEVRNSSVTLKLKRSGKIIRKVSQTPPLYSRSFKPPQEEPELEATDRFGALNHHAIKNAEIVYILKPMIHLGSVGLYGYNSWKSYFVSMFLDFYSIYQYYKHRNFMTSDQKKELSRRCVSMLLYILRSPFYDKYSNDKIDSFMRAMAKNIPFMKFIVEPYRQYIPQYQSTYFYMFSN